MIKTWETSPKEKERKKDPLNHNHLLSMAKTLSKLTPME